MIRIMDGLEPESKTKQSERALGFSLQGQDCEKPPRW